MINTACKASNGVISVSAQGGNGALAYSIDGINFQEAGKFKNLDTGSYNITVVDEQKCQSSLTVVLESMEGISIEIINTIAANCGANDGSFEAKVTGGNDNYQYKIDNSNFQSDSEFRDLAAGSYLLMVKDTNDCEASETIDIKEKGKIEITEIITSGTSSCNSADGSFLVMVEGGDGNYQYKLDEADFQPANEFINLSSKDYTLTVRDGKGCLVTQTVNIAEKNKVKILQISGTSSGCDISDGTLTIEAAGGDGNYQYKIGKEDFQISAHFTDLSAGKYEIMVKDGAGCVAFEDFQIFSNLSYFADIKPLITRGCIANECHAGTNDLLDMTDLEAIRENDSLIIEKIVNGNPISKNGTLTENEIKIITCWLEDGAPDN